MLQQHGMFKFNTYTHVDNTSGYLRSHPCFWVTSPLGCPKKWGVFIPSCERMEYSFEFFLLKLPSCLKLPKQVSNSSMYSFRVVDWEKKSSFWKEQWASLAWDLPQLTWQHYDKSTMKVDDCRCSSSWRLVWCGLLSNKPESSRFFGCFPYL